MFSSRLAGALGRAAVINSRAFIARCLAGVLNDASLRLARAFVFVGTECIRPPRLRPFVFDSPRFICRHPMDSVSRDSNLAHPLSTHRPMEHSASPLSAIRGVLNPRCHARDV